MQKNNNHLTSCHYMETVFLWIIYVLIQCIITNIGSKSSSFHVYNTQHSWININCRIEIYMSEARFFALSLVDIAQFQRLKKQEV